MNAAEVDTAVKDRCDNGAVRDCLLAEFRCVLILSKLATLEIEQLGIALKHGLISVPQTIALQDAGNPTDWLFQDKEDST